ncbi:beta strand repeat-containing protein [Sulfurimonas sp.]
MTIKNSLISVAASALLISAMTGCSSSDSTTAASTSSIPTSITATDGYVNNYSVTATYGDSNDTNITYATTAILANAVTHAKIAAGSAQTAGSAVMDLTQDLTASQIANLKFITLSRKAQSTDGTTLTYATYFDANGDSKFDTTAGDILAPAGFSMTAPVGYKIISPVTTLVQQRITQLTGSDTNQSQRDAHMTTALTQIAAGLGLTADKIKNIDPLTTVSSDPAYALINAMLGQAITDSDMAGIATSLATATAATTTSAALNNIAAGAVSGKAFYTNAANALSADSSMINSVSTWNLDALRSGTAGGATAFTPTLLAAGTGDYNVTSITIGSTAVNADTLLGSGAKINFTALDDTNITLAAGSDVNLTNKRLKLAVHVSGQETHIADDANITSLTVLVPIDLNSTMGTEAAAVAADVTWEGVNASGATFTGEMNASTFTAATYGVASGVSLSDGGLTFKIGSILTTLDGNSSSAAGIVDGNISSITVALVEDVNSTLNRISGSNTAYWGNNQVTSVLGGINVSGKAIFKNALTDSRAGATTTGAANKAPAHAFSITASDNVSGAGTTASPFIVNNNSLPVYNIGAVVYDENDKNTTSTYTFGGTHATAFDNNTSALVGATLNNLGATSTNIGNDINTTSTTAGDLNATLTTVLTDEFGDANTTVWYFRINRAPSAFEDNSTLTTVLDFNISASNSQFSAVDSVGTIVDGNTTYDGNVTNVGIKFVDLDGVDTQNYTAAGDWNLTVVATSAGCGVYTTLDKNITMYVGNAAGDYNISLTRTGSGTTAGYIVGLKDSNSSTNIATCEATLRAFDANKASDSANDTNITISVQ